MGLPIEWFRAEAARQQIPLDEEDLQAIAAFVNQARAALVVHRPQSTDGLEPTRLYSPGDAGREGPDFD